MKELDNRIDAWAEKVGIHESSTAMKQGLYTLSETQELLSALDDDDRPEIADAIGDIYVTLKNVAHFYGLSMPECVEGAVKIIEDRANRGGGMKDGVYVKPEEK